MDEYSCANNYTMLGYTTKEECCAEYPDYCECNTDYKFMETGFATKEECCKAFPQSCGSEKCTLLPYKSYKYVKCNPKGWKQNNNDCWIDSALYALFASPDTVQIFSNILDKLNDSHNNLEKEIALNISNYLEGLNDSSLSEECKVLCKNNIVNKILEWNRQHFYALNIGEDDEIINTQIRRNAGNIFEGPQEFLPKFFSLIESSMINFISVDQGPLIQMCKSKADKPIKQTLSSHISSLNITTPILMISINGIDYQLCQDKTRFVEIQELNNYVLKSIIVGQGVHITALLVCEDKLLYYNNENNPTISVASFYDDVLKNAEQLIFIYVKKTRSDNVSIKRSRSLKRSDSTGSSRSLKRSNSTRHSGTLKRSNSTRHSGTLKRSNSTRHAGTLKRSVSTRN